MASVPFLLVFYVFLFPHVSVKAATKNSNNITEGSSLSTNANNNSWSSPSGVFAFGFYPQGDGYAVGIWLVNQTGSTVVWTANRDDPPVSSNATLELTRDGVVLHQTDQQGKEIFIPAMLDNISSPAATSAAMLDDGNFQLLNASHHVLWQSFDYPTDTILGGQILLSSHQLVSSKSTSDQSSGPFLLVMEVDGNLVSYPNSRPKISYWSSESSGNYSAELSLNHSGFLLLQDSSKRPLRTWSNGDPGENKTVIYRATLDDDGIFRLYSHNFRSNTSSRVKVMWSSVKNHCDVLGICGLNGYCQMSSNDCFCYPGFVHIDPGNKFSGCYQNFTQVKCRDDEDNPRLRYNFTSFKNMSWADTPYAVPPLEEAACRSSCLQDCNCWAVLYTSTSCRKFNFPLRYGNQNPNISATALFKIVLENIVTPNQSRPVPENHGPMSIESKNSTIVILALSLGSVACLCFLFAISSFIVYKHRYRRYAKLLENAHLGLTEDFSLQSFSYNELERATNGFNEEIGKGTFGAVYRGILSESGNKAIAVKRLEKVVEEGVREFRAEMTTIGRTHHRNLVQLLGFCIEGSKKLLVYEFMSNGSLADRLFKAASPPTWRARMRFVLDVARGIFYLHEECGVHIIHCNLKPQNILLDDTWTAKISDFGLARLLMPNQAKASMGLQGTSIGYLAPEWQKNAMISVKSDIYSFGVVLLEIICCRRNIDVNVSTADEITLSQWVYTCFKAGELSKLVRDDDGVDFPTLERMIKVGMWCIQDDPTLRPLMKDVILMLEGTLVIPVPPSPELVIVP
ncbi:hypothetical protein FNV43_RR18823 [Rhamnella rubrinervis]|uniref:Receptor-like serine/threonine-protein kinase n=1 Tax=Rhamnella rubrinervis TaxID=2594499 RepID=A0A8K0E706_9ROSA|nr:hypothetical protein FNV43_RR18823 [Rhamnella rubrinervis]